MLYLTHLIFLKDEGLRQLLGKFLMAKMSFTLLYLKQMKKLMMEKYTTKKMYSCRVTSLVKICEKFRQKKHMS